MDIFDQIPIPILAGLLLVVLIAAGVFLIGLTKKWGPLLPYSGMLLFSAMATPVDWNDRIRPTLWLPIQTKRSILFLICSLSLSFVVLVQLQHLKGKAQSILAWMFFTLAMYASLMRAFHEGPVSGIESAAFTLVVVPPLILLPAIVMRHFSDFRMILYAIILSNAVWTLMVAAQMLINPQLVTVGGSVRFVGVFANPQHTGVYLSHICVILLWLLMNQPGKLRLVLLALMGINMVFLLWTGSRTGGGMFVIGVCAIVYPRAGKTILLLPIILLLTYISFSVLKKFIGEDISFDRLTNTENTRAIAWNNLITQAKSKPLTGVGIEESQNSENSWLYGFASYGIGMFGLLTITGVMAIWYELKWLRQRFSIDPYYRPMLDLCMAGIAMYFAGAVLEGYMISRVSASLCFIPIYCSAGAIIVKFALAPDQSYEYDEEEWESYGEELPA
ncbi:MAG: hypothetical protein CMJ35_10365 [Phycisphaerae bacterium]|nr:hypothetical protein [Phycisphaerae bacterium]MBM92000.1 hypothetical protein [Phycisphaerae bacterium]